MFSFYETYYNQFDLVPNYLHHYLPPTIFLLVGGATSRPKLELRAADARAADQDAVSRTTPTTVSKTPNPWFRSIFLRPRRIAPKIIVKTG